MYKRQKEDYPRIFKSDIIMDLMRVLGCGVEIKDKRIKNLGAFDLDNLNWNKVIICTDADVDGYHIRTLVLTMLYRLVPTLIDEGYVYIAESPLYEINCKEKTYFAYTELEKNGDVYKRQRHTHCERGEERGRAARHRSALGGVCHSDGRGRHLGRGGARSSRCCLLYTSRCV